MEKSCYSQFKKGLLISLVLIVNCNLFHWSNNKQTLNSFSYIPLFGGIVWAAITAKQMNGSVTFGNVFCSGFKTSAFVVALQQCILFVAVNFLFPDMSGDKLLSKKQMQSQNNLGERTK